MSKKLLWCLICIVSITISGHLSSASAVTETRNSHQSFDTTAEQNGLDAAVRQALQTGLNLEEIIRIAMTAGYGDNAIVHALLQAGISPAAIQTAAASAGLNTALVQAALGSGQQHGDDSALGFSEGFVPPPYLPSIPITAGGNSYNRSVSRSTF